MKNKVLFRISCGVALLASMGLVWSSFAQTPSLINCQGRLFDGEKLLDGEVNMILRIFDQPEGGNLLYEDVNKVQVVDGIYSTFLGDNTTKGRLNDALSLGTAYLEVSADGTTFMPREALSSVPFAKVAEGVRKAGVTAEMIGPKSVQGDALAPGAVNTDHIADGAVTPPKLSEAYWSTSGNVSQGGKITFVGTLDGRPLDLRVGNKRAFRLEPAKTSPNVVGGHEVNRSGDGVNGATVSGGGAPGAANRAAADYAAVGGGVENVAGKERSTVSGGRANIADGIASAIGGGYSNKVTQSYGTVGGGYNNQNGGYVATVAGGWNNQAAGKVATVGGGQENHSLGAATTVAGGWKNTAGGNAATVAGGHSNTASGNFASVGGGTNNMASGDFAVVPGGGNNEAGAPYSLAGGQGARASHPGAFVWSDSQAGGLASTGNDQFLIQAAGNVGIDTNTPSEKLTVAGNVKANQFIGDGSRLTGVFGADTAFKGDVAGTAKDLRIRPGSVGANHLAPGLIEESVKKSELAGQVSQLMRSSVSKDAVLKGDVVGTMDNLQLKPGAVTADKLAPGLINESVKKSALAGQVSQLMRSSLSKDSVVKGDVVGTLDNLQLKPGAVTADKLADGVIEAGLKKSGLPQQLTQIAGQMLPRNQKIQGDVAGSLDKVKLQPGVVGAAHLAPELQKAIQEAGSKGLAPEVSFGGDVVGTYTNLQLRSGVVTPDALAPKLIENAINQSTLASEVARLKRIAVGKDQMVAGDVVGTLNQMKIKDGAISPKKLSPEIRAGLQDLEEGMMRNDQAFVGDVEGSATTLKIKKGAVTADKLAPDVLEQALNQSLVAGQMAKLQRQVVTRDFVAGGEVAGTLDGLQVRKGAITAEKLSPQLNATLAKLAEQSAPKTINFGGDVSGPSGNLQLAKGIVGEQELSPELNALLKELAAMSAPRDLKFGGDVRGTSDNLQLAKGVVNVETIDPQLLNQLMQAAGDPLQVNTAFKGDVVGTAEALIIRPGAITADKLAPGVLRAEIQNSDLASMVAKVSGASMGKDTIFNGDVVGTAANLKIKPGLLDAAVKNSPVTRDLQAQINAAGSDGDKIEKVLTAIDGVKRNTLSANTRFEGEVAGTVQELRIQRNAVKAEHVAPGAITREKLNLVGSFEPGRNAQDTLGSSKVRWKSVFVKDRIDYDDTLTFTSGGVVKMVVDGGGNLSVEGLRLSAHAESPSLIGGHNANRIDQGAVGATIAGGGNANQPNVVSSQYGSIAGGFGNRVTGFNSSVGGGQDNLAGGKASAIAGGFMNKADGLFPTVGGGAANMATSNASVISGGFSNKVEGAYAMIPGGYQNFATGDFSLAAGYRAMAAHDGSFVWSDSVAGDFSSTAPNQFSVRASGGTRFYSNQQGTSGVKLSAGSGSWAMLSDRNAKENIVEIDDQAVLDRLAELPVYTWNYRAQDADVKHIGPTSQEFYEAFGMGDEDTHITAIDADGVALSAIKGLVQRLKTKDAELAALREENADLKVRFEDIESKVNTFFELLENLPEE